MIYYVDGAALQKGNGSCETPFQTIQEAADIAKSGDTVKVLPGVYRENVNPKYAGKPGSPVVYISVRPLEAIITGAEVLKGWERISPESDVWTVRVSNSLFTERNPYTTFVSGDWFMAGNYAHTGDIFLNDKSMYETDSLEAVISPVVSATSWDKDFSVYTWYCEQDVETNETVFYGNFQGKDPNIEKVEFTVRSNCFYPQEEGIGYITLSGFTVCKAATQWAPPTAYQEGMIGPHWSKGWVIENCDISESKCVGISLGKYFQKENDNKWYRWKYKDGTQTERECILQAQREGWTKDRIGSHVIRHCEIHDCGQAGIVGHLGCVFSVIEDNHIYHINNKQNLAGAEIGGIKLHAAIDVVIRRNHFHHCTRGLWLDWQAQGTRVTQNLFHDNNLPHVPDGTESLGIEALMRYGQDIFIEVSHGPTLVDNNILLSDIAVKMPTQGVAMVHNLIAGSFSTVGKGTDNGAKTLASPRYTPYHVPHQTEVAGFMTILHGDDRFYNNIFVQMPVRPVMKQLSDFINSGEEEDGWEDANLFAGTFVFSDYPTMEEWENEFSGYCGMGSEASDRYYMHLPVMTGGNLFLGGARPSSKEKDFILNDRHNPEIALEVKEDGWYLSWNLADVLKDIKTEIIHTDTLGMAFEPEEKYENPDGSPIIFDADYFGLLRETTSVPGPFKDICGVYKVTDKL